MAQVKISDIADADAGAESRLLGVDALGNARLFSAAAIPDGVIDGPGVQISVSALTQIQPNITFTTTAVGDVPAGGGDRPTLALSNNSLTHAKVLYVPAGFAGHCWWMAATPFFGVVGSDPQYENPHVFYSDDGLAFFESAGVNPIDLTVGDSDSSNYYSDTHLVIADDGWMYCIYRSVGSQIGGGTSNWYRRTRDGVSWSDRVFIISSLSQVSPAVYKHKSAYIYYDVVLNPSGPSTRGVQRLCSFSGPVSGYDSRSTQNFITFDSEPWGASDGPWHIDVDFIGGVHLALINTGPKAASGGIKLWLAYSFDGWAYRVIDQQIGPAGMYRSCITPIRVGQRYIDVRVYMCSGGQGVISPYDCRLGVSPL